MSLIDQINDKLIWKDYLNTKENSKVLPLNIVKKYQEYINNEKYKDIAQGLINGQYSFSVPKKVLIGKMGKNKKRIVYMYKEDENYILKLLSHLMYKYDYMFSPNLYSFRKNIGVKKAIGTITQTKGIKKKYVYKVDIHNYFNSIPVDKLLKSLKEDLDDEKLYKLIESLLKNKKVQFQDKIIEEEKGIMAGVPISSFLANYYLKDLDSFFYEKKVLYARYADDIIVFGETKEQVQEYQKEIKDFLMQKKLTVNEEKEFFYNPGEKIEFLGFSYFNGVIDISNNTFKKIKGKIKRTARGIRRWMIKNKASTKISLKAMNRKYNNKFFGKNENDLTWKYWFFPIINTDITLRKIDRYMQDEQRYVVTGVHNKRNFEKVPYEFLKECNYKSLVNEYHKTKE